MYVYCKWGTGMCTSINGPILVCTYIVLPIRHTFDDFGILYLFQGQALIACDLIQIEGFEESLSIKHT